MKNFYWIPILSIFTMSQALSDQPIFTETLSGIPDSGTSDQNGRYILTMVNKVGTNASGSGSMKRCVGNGVVYAINRPAEKITRPYIYLGGTETHQIYICRTGELAVTQDKEPSIQDCEKVANFTVTNNEVTEKNIDQLRYRPDHFNIDLAQYANNYPGCKPEPPLYWDIYSQ